MMGTNKTYTDARIEALCLYTVSAAFLLIAVVSIYTADSSILFYVAFAAFSVAVGLAVTRKSSYQEGIFLLLVGALILRSIVPLSKPGMIIDNYPDAYIVRYNVLTLMSSGSLPVSSNFFADFPGANLLLASLQMVSGIDLSILLKYLPVFLILPVFGAIPLAVRAFGIDSNRAELIATTIVVAIPFLMEGTSHTSPHSFGTILLIVGLAFFLDSLSSKWESGVSFLIVASALVIYHLTSSLFLLAVASLLSLTLAVPQLRRRSEAHGNLLVLFMFLAVAFWYMYSSASSGIWSELSQTTGYLTSYEIATNVKPLVPVGVKPLWMVMIEYLAFGGLGVALLVSLFTKTKGLFLLKLFTLIGIFLASGFAVPWLLGLNAATDLFERSFVLLIIGAAPLVGANFGKTTQELPNTLSQHISRSQFRNLLVCTLIILLVLNSVFYAFPVYYYDASIPIQSEDTRYNLQEWQSLGIFVSQYGDPNQPIWGPRLGVSLVGDYSNHTYHPFVVQTENYVAINASLFPYLPELARGQYIVISWAMLTAPDISGYTPNIVTPAKISTRVYDNGEIVMLVGMAPDSLMYAPNVTLTGPG